MEIENVRLMFADNGNGYDMSDAGLLLLLGHTLYGGDPEMTDEAKACAQVYIDTVLRAAVTGGFMQSDIFITMLVNGKLSVKAQTLALEASDAAGPDANNVARVRWRGGN